MHFFDILSATTGALSFGSNSPNDPVNAVSRNTTYSVQTPPLDTAWTYDVGTNPWPQYPRPKLARSQWQSLNGVWTYANASGKGDLSVPPFNQTLSREVLVPFCLESGLSGIQGANTVYSWYRTTFTVPRNWDGNRVLLNFGAVDYEATVFVNGRTATFHRGGYFAFSLDVTDYLIDGENELAEAKTGRIVFAFDPTDSDPYVIPTGKQALNPSHIFYRPCSGIWQSVWIESAPSNHISDLRIDATASGQLNLTVTATGSKHVGIQQFYSYTQWYRRFANYISRRYPKNVVSRHAKSLRHHDRDGPRHGQELHRIQNDIKRRSQWGTESNAGYWPDGLYTPPTYEAMTFDIKTLKRLGYNMLRKHVKVESALYYAAADELGILIMQDMPCLRPSRGPNKAQQAEFERQLEVLVTQFRSYTSIFAWAIYNEGWGQLTSYHPEFALTKRIHELDPTRLVNAASGWHDYGAGEFSDNHHYPAPQCGTPWADNAPFDPLRIGFEGEFGGTGHNVSAEHLWKVKDAINAINETYEMYETLEAWNLRGHYLLTELRSQIELYSCAGGVWTQTTDVEGEVNGMLSYDRRILRTDVQQWKEDIQVSELHILAFSAQYVA
nr:beta-galactosidase [Quercus suber]